MATVQVAVQLSSEALLQAVTQLSNDELNEFVVQVVSIAEQRKLAEPSTASTSAALTSEATLLKKATQTIPPDIHQRLQILVPKRESEALTETEQQEFLQWNKNICSAEHPAMTVALQRLSFQDDLNHDDGTDTHNELVEGALIPMALGTGKHGAVMKFLEKRFNREIDRLGLPWTAHRGDIGVQSPQRGRRETSRIPDVVVLPTEQWKELAQREAVIRLDEPPSLLVVEVVSESTVRTDYRTKRAKYNVLGIEEYWIVDPLEAKVTVCLRIDDLYESSEFVGEAVVGSRRFPDLKLTAAAILEA